MNPFTFEYPIVFLVLLLFLVCLKFCRQKSIGFYFPNMTMLQKAAAKKVWAATILKILSILFLVTALASPVKEDDVVINNDKGYEISLILDASGSMKAYNKFGIVKNIVDDFITKREHDKLGLSIFADFAYVAVPLTYDKQSLKRLLDRLEVGIAGKQRTALYEALFLSANLFKTSTAKHKIAILLTDGVDNTGTIPLDVAINTAKKYGIKVYTIGVGQAGDFNPGVLQKISRETGGEYFAANTVDKLKEVYSTIDTLEKSDIKAQKYIKKSYYFQYFLGIGLFFVLLYFVLVNKE